MGNRKYTMLFDGFGRYSRFDFKDGKVKFMSRIMDTKYLRKSKKENTVIPGLVFGTPKPADWRSKIPTLNLIYNKKYNDNMWVTLERLADNKTYVTTNDSK